MCRDDEVAFILAVREIQDNDELSVSCCSNSPDVSIMRVYELESGGFLGKCGLHRNLRKAINGPQHTERCDTLFYARQQRHLEAIETNRRADDLQKAKSQTAKGELLAPKSRRRKVLQPGGSYIGEANRYAAGSRVEVPGQS